MKKFNDFRKTVDPGEIKTVGYRFIDAMAEYMDRVQNTDQKVVHYLPPDQSHAFFDEPMPAEGRELDEVLGKIRDLFLKYAQNMASPMYMGHQVSHPLILSALAEGLGSAVNQGLAIFEMSPTGTMIEKRIMRWLCDAVGYGRQSDGTIVSGGTAANLTGIMVGRTIKAGFDIWRQGVAEPMIGFCAARSHYSVERAFGILGLGTQNLVRVEETPDFRMDPDRLRRAVKQCLAEKKKPFLVTALAGCTPVGAFDPLDEIADICEEYDLWLHVDGAHGAAFVFSEKMKPLLKGLERADSISLDPHKMMFMPMSLGTVMLKNQKHLDRTFNVAAPYLFQKTQRDLGCLNLGERTIQCSRGFDSFKLWVCLQHYGIRYFGAMMEHCVQMTRYLYERLREDPDFEPLHDPQCNILCFQYVPDPLKRRNREAVDAFNLEVREALNRTGQAWITTTVFAGKRLLRTTIINPRTVKEHVDRLIQAIKETGAKLQSG
ncbi:MAG: hypothetical protein EHM45_01790 [Desulfobacteraceae bacterium]|nr:MAG: hypothetical protein EHM45_01790 [Desulfobacteraceae bacterium]